MTPRIDQLTNYARAQITGYRWRHIHNERAFARQRRQPLNSSWPARNRILDEFRRNGIVSFMLSDLEGGARLQDELFEDFEREVALQETEICRRRGILTGQLSTDEGSYKNSLLSWYPGGTVPTFDHPLTRWALHPEILSLVNAYYGLYARLLTMKYWYSVAAEDMCADGSQMWHRDYNDLSMVKTFIYVNDVDENTGPFNYAKGTHRGWLRATDPVFVRDSANSKRVTDEEMDRFVGKSNEVTMTGRAGTVIMTDVSGYHKGGFATKHDRKMIVATYVSPHCRDRLSTAVQGVDPHAPDAIRVAAGLTEA